MGCNRYLATSKSTVFVYSSLTCSCILTAYATCLLPSSDAAKMTFTGYIFNPLLLQLLCNHALSDFTAMASYSLDHTVPFLFSSFKEGSYSSFPCGFSFWAFSLFFTSFASLVIRCWSGRGLAELWRRNKARRRRRRECMIDWRRGKRGAMKRRLELCELLDNFKHTIS